MSVLLSVVRAKKIKLAVLMVFVAAFLQACGGGGGGGGGDAPTPNTSGSSGGTTTPPPSSPVADVQNNFLPTSTTITWTYNNNAQVSFLPDDIRNGLHLHALVYPTGGKEYFVTATDKINLHGLFLPSITVGDGVAYTAEVRFGELLPIFHNDAIAGSIQNISGSGTIDIAPTYGQQTLSYTGSVQYAGDEIVSTSLGNFTAKRINVSLSLASTVAGHSFTLPYNVNFWLVKDVGLVRRDQGSVSYLLSGVVGLNVVGSADPVGGSGSSGGSNSGGNSSDSSGNGGVSSGSGSNGSGSSNGGGGNATPPFVLDIHFNLPKLFAEFDIGDTRSMAITGTHNLSINAGATVRLIDSGTAIDQSWSVLPDSDGTFSMSFQPRANLAAGTYTGTVSLKFCKDAACTDQYDGSPVTLPYDVRVHAITSDLKPLTPLAGAGDWLEYRGGPAHTGAIASALTVQDFTRRWQWLPQDADISRSSAVVTYQGSAFFTTNHGHMGISPLHGRYVIALNENTGVAEWSNAIPCCFDMSPPAVANGRVYAAIGGSGSWGMRTYDATSGANLWTTGFAAQWNTYLPPSVQGGILFQHSGYNNGGLLALNAATGSVLWSDDTLWDTTSPGAVAADATYIYSVMIAQTGPYAPDPNNRPALHVMNQSTGAIVRSIFPASAPTTGIGSRSPTPVLSGVNSAILGYLTNTGFHLEKMDTAAATTVWSTDFPLSDTTLWGSNLADNQAGLDPVVIGGTVYVVNPAQLLLEARRESDGALLWSWKPPAVDQSPVKYKTSVAAASNMVFIKTDRFVYAIDTTTGETVWRYWNTGELSISANGILYVVRAGGIIDAINLH